MAKKNGGPGKHLNLNVRGLGNSATVAINDLSNQLRGEGREVYKLGLGQSPFPVPAHVVEALRARAAEKDYLPTQGLAALREAVAGHLHRLEGVERSAGDVLIGPGSKELMFLLQLVFYGDLVIPTPAWVSYAPQARILGRTVRLIDTEARNDWRLTAERLERLCAEDQGRPRILILNYPSNPTGGTFSVQELKSIARVAREHRVLLLSDEIYGELHHKGQHVSICRFYPEGTIVSSGLSKWCGAGGWRIGSFVFPPGLAWLRESMTAAASETYTSVSAPIQYAAVTAFEGGAAMENYLEGSRRVLAALGRWIVKTMQAAGIDCARPQGAFYLFPNFEPVRATLASRGITTASELTRRLLEETGVAILPGEAFGRPPEELTTRIAYVDFDGARALAAEEAAGRDATLSTPFLREHCAPVVNAIERLCEWVQS